MATWVRQQGRLTLDSSEPARRAGCRALLIPLLLILPLAPAWSQDKIQPWLQAQAQGEEQIEFLVIMQDQPDLSPARALSTKAEKGRFVHQALQRQALTSQAPLREWLEAMGIEYRSFTIVNALWVKGNRRILELLAQRADVARLEANPRVAAKLPHPQSTRAQPALILGVEWNIVQTKAPEVWVQGFQGEGIVIGGQDTGYRWTHEALKTAYRGWSGTTEDHDYNWHDAIHSGGGSCGADSPVPCDDHGHGTHTMGTALGDDGGANQIGMAPGAKWIGCRNMDQGTGSPATYLECFDFFLAPYPVGGDSSQGDPAKAPDITTNSWGCLPSEGCSALTLKEAVDNLRAAGILTIASAGNSGPGCGTVNAPPGLYDSTYTVGNLTSSSTISPSSSRGPAATTGLVKPDIMAPGTSVRSAYASSDTAYVTMTGTSMAAPHVAGAAALIASAAPGFRKNPSATEELLNASALPLPDIIEGCGGDYTHGPNNSWGHGALDVMAAYENTLIDDLVLQGETIDAKAIYQARRTITLGPALIVAPSGTLSLRAGERIIFDAGFRVETGASLTAWIDPRLLPVP